MEISPEVVAAKEALEDPLLQAGLITGIDFGVASEDDPDPEDLALRVFVANATDIPFQVTAALATFPFPVIVLQRVFRLTGQPDLSRHRPVVGGVSVSPRRFAGTSFVPAGTLGAIVTDDVDPTILYGLSCHHVLCVDLNRQVGDEIVQPEPGILGSLPGDRVGTLHDWSFPETTADGLVDAAIFKVEKDSRFEIAEIGPVSGSVVANHTMQVTKRGKTTGQTFGWVSGDRFSVIADYPHLPAVGNPPSTARIMKNQLHVNVLFPDSIVFGEEGDSGAIAVGDGNRAVGMHIGSGSENDGDPLRFGVLTPAVRLEIELGITF